MVTPLTYKPLLSHFALHQKLIEDDTLKIVENVLLGHIDVKKLDYYSWLGGMSSISIDEL